MNFQNLGNATVNLGTMTVTGPFTISSTTCSTTVGPLGKCSIAITFSPTETGAELAMSPSSDSDNLSPQVPKLTGTGD